MPKDGKEDTWTAPDGWIAIDDSGGIGWQIRDIIAQIYASEGAVLSPEGVDLPNDMEVYKRNVIGETAYSMYVGLRGRRSVAFFARGPHNVDECPFPELFQFKDDKTAGYGRYGESSRTSIVGEGWPKGRRAVTDEQRKLLNEIIVPLGDQGQLTDGLRKSLRTCFDYLQKGADQ